jgi:hypothetical protein
LAKIPAKIVQAVILWICQNPTTNQFTILGRILSARNAECILSSAKKKSSKKSSVIGFPKGILFDDEEKNRAEWNGTAHDVHNVIEILKGLA